MTNHFKRAVDIMSRVDAELDDLAYHLSKLDREDSDQLAAEIREAASYIADVNRRIEPRKP